MPGEELKIMVIVLPLNSAVPVSLFLYRGINSRLQATMFYTTYR